MTQRLLKSIFMFVVLLAISATASSSAFSQTLKSVKARGVLNCGVNPGLLGFSSRDEKGNWSGFDVDLCRGLAAAIFNDPNKVSYIPVSTANRFSTLKEGKIDVLSRNSTWTMSREADLGLNFPAVSYYDGQGFLVRRAMNVDSALELSGVRVCVQSGTTTLLNLVDFFQANKTKYETVQFDNLEELFKAYDAGRCDALTSDVSQLFVLRIVLAKPDDHVILPDIISKEPLGPVVRENDIQWSKILKWTLFAMINAEELGVSSQNISEALNSNKPDVRRLLGKEGDYGEKMGLTNDWAARVVKFVGNYGEVFERNVGVGSKLAIPRGINQLWSRGGIQYAPPIR